MNEVLTNFLVGLSVLVGSAIGFLLALGIGNLYDSKTVPAWVKAIFFTALVVVVCYWIGVLITEGGE